MKFNIKINYSSVFFLCFVDRASLCNHFQMKPSGCTLLLSIFISTSIHVSGSYVPIIRRTYFINATLVFFILYGWLPGLMIGMSLIPTITPDSHPVSSQPVDQTVTQSHPNQHTRQPHSLIPTSTPDSHPVSSQPTHQTATQSHPNQHTRQPPSLIPTSTPDSHPYRVKNTSVA